MIEGIYHDASSFCKPKRMRSPISINFFAILSRVCRFRPGQYHNDAAVAVVWCNPTSLFVIFRKPASYTFPGSGLYNISLLSFLFISLAMIPRGDKGLQGWMREGSRSLCIHTAFCSVLIYFHTYLAMLLLSCSGLVDSFLDRYRASD
jgi:hypothetical protein